MKIEKGKKQGLKKLLVSILVMTLLVTMLPHNAIEKLIVKAEEIVVPTDADKAIIVEAKTTTNTDNIIIPAYEVVNQALEEYATSPDKYADGIVIKVSSDLDLSYVNVEGGIIPQNMYFVFTGNYKLYGCERLCSLSEVMEAFYVYIAGPGTIYAQSEETAGTVGEIENWAFCQGFHVTIGSDVNIDTVCFEVVQGCGINLFGVDKTIENVLYSEYDVIFYSKSVGLYKYDGKALYMDEISPAMIKDKTFDLRTIDKFVENLYIEKIVYTEAALPSIPEGTKLIFDNKCEVSQYEVPKIPFIVDMVYGLYSLEETDDGMTMTVYSAYAAGSHMEHHQINTNSTEEKIPVRIDMLSNYTYTKVVDGEETTLDCDKVIFTENAIPATYVKEEQTYRVDRIIMYLFTAPDTDFYFDMKNHAGLTVYNHTDAAVNFINENNNELWVKFSENSPQVEYVPQIDIATKMDGTNTYYYAKAGTSYTLKPEENYSIFDVKMGSGILDGDSYEYYRLADLDHVNYNVDGSVNFTIPNFGSNITFSAEEIGTVAADMISTEPMPQSDKDSIYWYDEAFTVSVRDHDICDVTENKSGSWSDSIEVDEEGQYQKTYYVIDRTLEEDGVTPSATYGKISKLDYSYVIDLKSPEITEVSAKDETGNVLSLDGGWQDLNQTESDSEMVWVKGSSVTVTAKADETAETLSSTAYKFVDEWQASDSYTYTGDGVYEVEIYVRDQFDEATGRESDGKWVTAFGIDNSAPVLLYTDANTSDQSALKNDTTYEGNLYLECNDGDGSGFAEIHLYKKRGEEWIEADDLLVEGEDGIYLAPDVDEAVYRVEVTDVVGNTTTYENVTMLAYTQDVKVTIGNTTAKYGEGLEIPITITNIGEKELFFSGANLREDATDSVFEIGAKDLTELLAGETATITVSIPSDADAAVYDAMIDIGYTSMGGTLETNIEKIYSHYITTTISKAAGEGTVSVADCYYGEELDIVKASETNGIEDAEVYFKKSSAKDSSYTKTVPTAVGTYDVKVVYPATTNYEEVVAKSSFKITRMSASDSMYSIVTKPDEQGVYREDVIIEAKDGGSLCTTEDGTFAQKLTISETTENFVFYVKTSTGAITEKIALGKIVIDKSVPEEDKEPEEEKKPEIPQEIPSTEEQDEPEEIVPIKISIGRMRLELGKAYTFGSGKWKVSGDSTSYAPGITFYVPSEGDYEFSQE